MCMFERVQSPLFVKTRDFVVWLFQHTSRFPRQYRHTLSERIEKKSLDLLSGLGRLVMGCCAEGTGEVDFVLWELRQLLALAGDLGLLSGRQLEHAAASLAEIGRLVGGVRKKGTGA